MDSFLGRSGMALINEESRSFTCQPHVYPHMEWAMPAFTSLGRCSFFISLRIGGYGLDGWLRTEVVCPSDGGHPPQY